jgi:hypothetical protein
VIGAAEMRWSRADLTSVAGGSDAGGFPVGYTTSLGGEGPAARVVYRGADGHVHQLKSTGGGTWSHADLTAAAGAPLGQPVNSTPMAYTTSLAGEGPAARVVYQIREKRVHELCKVGAGAWSHSVLSVIAGAPAADSAPTGYATNLGGEGPAARVVYRGTDGHVHELCKVGGGDWSHTDLTAAAGATDAQGVPLVSSMGYATSLDGQGPTARVVYTGPDRHLHELSTVG